MQIVETYERNKVFKNIANTKYKYIRLRVAEEEQDYLKELVKRNGYTLSDFIRIFLDDFINKGEE